MNLLINLLITEKVWNTTGISEKYYLVYNKRIKVYPVGLLGHK